MTKQKKRTSKHRVHKELEGFRIDINEYGEIVYSKSLDELNAFLDKHVKDKKFQGKKVVRKIGHQTYEIQNE